VKQFRALRNRWWLTGWWIVLAGWWIVLGGALPAARAAHVVPMTVERMADHAAQVIVGEVTKVAAHWAEAPRRIETTIEFANVEFLKGALPRAEAEPFVLTVPGGRIGEMQMRVCCAPEFQVGQRWCLFLLASSPTYPVVGLYNGALRIEIRRAGRRAHAVSRWAGGDRAGPRRLPARRRTDCRASSPGDARGPQSAHRFPPLRGHRNRRCPTPTSANRCSPSWTRALPTHQSNRRAGIFPSRLCPARCSPQPGPLHPRAPRERAGPPRGSDAVPQVPAPRRSEVRP
jgi:hypothetical protein